MTCGGCVRGVTAAVRDLDPAAEVEADLDRRRARITTTAPEARVRAVLTEAGYMG
ncbi:MAG: heavy-metal-associated domain-containing protein [Rubellimicrobium sp.]|nr:heavy-metal-associated domain-containing protein [Rubellimicrobium sp.]